MTEAIDIKKVIQGSTCDMSVDALTKKGVKQVKVVNQATITRLISQTIDKVLAERQQEMSAAERERVLKEARAQFDSIARERVAKERGRIEELDRANHSLQSELEQLKNRLQSMGNSQAGAAEAQSRIVELEEAVAHVEQERQKIEVAKSASDTQFAEVKARLQELEAQASSSSAEVKQLRDSVVEKDRQIAGLEARLAAREEELQAARSGGGGPGHAEAHTQLADRIQTSNTTASAESGMVEALARLTERIENMPVAAAGGGGAMFKGGAPDDVAMDFLTGGGGKIESNIENVNVKQKTAGDVQGALARLKKLQQGGGE